MDLSQLHLFHYSCALSHFRIKFPRYQTAKKMSVFLFSLSSPPPHVIIIDLCFSRVHSVPSTLEHGAAISQQFLFWIGSTGGYKTASISEIPKMPVESFAAFMSQLFSATYGSLILLNSCFIISLFIKIWTRLPKRQFEPEVVGFPAVADEALSHFSVSHEEHPSPTLIYQPNTNSHKIRP